MMKNLTLTCQNEQRRHDVRDAEALNGLDYLEVSDDQLTLTVYFLGKAPDELTKENVRIEGGQRINDIKVVKIKIVERQDGKDDFMDITVDKPGDFSTYTLCLVELDDNRPTDKLLSSFDPRYACLEFNFKVGYPSELDCKQEAICPPEAREEPEINYLAKDYASFRQLILDRLSLIMPDWNERHIPDLGVVLVEVLAYVGDHLSYYQDAVLTEAYLETSRQRISVRRHARLVDYHIHEGCNARTWIYIKTDSYMIKLQPDKVSFITRNKELPVERSVLTWDDLRNIPSNNYELFGPLVENREEPIKLYKAHNIIYFHTWGDRECCLPRGATMATLKDTWAQPEQPVEPKPEMPEQCGPMDDVYQFNTEQQCPKPHIPERKRKLNLRVGDVLIFEEVIGPKTGNPADADPTHRHAVRLTGVEPGVDDLYNQPIVKIAWAEEDSLPFSLCISAVGPAPDCILLDNISVALGNIILADHGRRVIDEALGCVPVKTKTIKCEGEGLSSDLVKTPGRFQPYLKEAPLTFSEPLPDNAPATIMLNQDPHKSLPWMNMMSIHDPSCNGEKPVIDTDPTPIFWSAQSDIVNSNSQDYHYVAEMDDTGRAHVRFGDGELGRLPDVETSFKVTYRIGNGPAGNVGAETISYIVLQDLLSGVKLQPRNPMSAKGGTSVEPLKEIKMFAPYTFRKKLQRAITAQDYAEIVMRDFQSKVQRAAAVLRWTGSWYEVLVAVDVRGQVKAEQELLDKIHGHLYLYRRIGHDVTVKPARYVPLKIEMDVCVHPHYLRGHIKAVLLAIFSNRLMTNGQSGFFHPDNLSFGEGIYLSKLVAAAQAVPGVESVSVEKLERSFEGPNNEIKMGILPLGPLEVVRLDNDPGFPENGIFKLNMRGGR